MSLALVIGLIQFLLLMMMNPAAEGRHLGRKSEDSNVTEAVAVNDSSNTRRADLGAQSELVSRRRWYGSQMVPWNDHDMQWLKRTAEMSVADGDKRGWGNGIPPWIRHGVVVVPLG